LAQQKWLVVVCSQWPLSTELGRRDFEGDTRVIACISIERDDVPHGTALLLCLDDQGLISRDSF
jgi:hypothetical protein